MRDITFNNVNINNPQGLFITNLAGISPTCVINSSTMSGFDGATVSSNTLPIRNITITLLLQNEEEKQLVYDTFRIKKVGIFKYEGKKIECLVESVDIPMYEKPIHAFISLLCPQPYFESLTQLQAKIASVIPLFSFPFTFPTAKTITKISDFKNIVMSGRDFQECVFYGKTLETGIGEKSVENQYVIKGVGESGNVPLVVNGTTINLPVASPLYNVGEVYDYIGYKDGQWGVQRNFVKWIFNGTENWAPNTPWNTSEPTIYHAYCKFGYPYPNSKSVTNMLPWVAGWGGNLGKEVCYNDSAIVMFIKADRLSEYTMAGFKQYLANMYNAGTPIYSIIQLKTPTFTPFPEEIQTQLDEYAAKEKITVSLDTTTQPTFSDATYTYGNSFLISKKSESVMVEVENTSSVDVGMNIVFYANSALSNPSLLNVNTSELAKINLDMLAGDTITISTYQGKKSIRLIRNGVETNIINNKAIGFKFLQLYQGANLFRYNADSNINGLEVSIYYKEYFAGV